MRHVAIAMVAVLASASGQAALACDRDTGARAQHVFLDWNGKGMTDWVVSSVEPTAVDLPNGFKLGVALADAPQSKYDELDAQRGAAAHVPELVEIRLFDLSANPPLELSRTWAGTNSVQGFGARGGANTVIALGDPGIEMVLLKPVCAAEVARVAR